MVSSCSFILLVYLFTGTDSSSPLAGEVRGPLYLYKAVWGQDDVPWLGPGVVADAQGALPDDVHSPSKDGLELRVGPDLGLGQVLHGVLKTLRYGLSRISPLGATGGVSPPDALSCCGLLDLVPPESLAAAPLEVLLLDELAAHVSVDQGGFASDVAELIELQHEVLGRVTRTNLGVKHGGVAAGDQAGVDHLLDPGLDSLDHWSWGQDVKADLGEGIGLDGSLLRQLAPLLLRRLLRQQLAGGAGLGDLDAQVLSFDNPESHCSCPVRPGWTGWMISSE